MRSKHPARVVAAVVTLSLVGLLAPGGRAATLFAVAAMSLPAVLLLLAEPGRGSGRRLVGAAVTTAALLSGGLVFLTRLTGGAAASVWVLGLPLGLAIQVWVMTLMPLLVVGLLFALDFDRFRPRPGDLEQIRRLADDDA